MTRTILSAFLLLLCTPAQAQNPEGFDEMIEQMVKGTVPFISSEHLRSMDTETIFLLDTRESDEFEVSHLKGAQMVGYDDLDTDYLESIPIGATIVTYCSIGYRSEKVGQRLLSLGHEKVFNLKGGIFDWVNNGGEINSNGSMQVHGYDQSWSKWLNKEKTQVVLEITD